MTRGPLRGSDPRRVGPYRLEQRLGSGGMGQVFLGRSRGGRLVAVKVVRPDLADEPKFRRRFAEEVKAASKVGGFYTAQVVTADPQADPPWLATAYIPGPSLAEIIDECGPLPLDTLSELGAGLTEGLAAIHACDLVHRDLKPGNVIIAADGPRVIDFGIAHAVDASSTTTMKVIGTPPFMSPEQAQAEQVGPASDVFSLGSVLTFAATGHGPFTADKIPAILYRIVHNEPDLTGLPEELVDLVSACLAKDPADRPGLEEILDRLAKPTKILTCWHLPPTVTAMIKERENGTHLLTTGKSSRAESPDEDATESTTAAGSTRNAKVTTADGPRKKPASRGGRQYWGITVMASVLLLGLVGGGYIWQKYRPDACAQAFAARTKFNDKISSENMKEVTAAQNAAPQDRDAMQAAYYGAIAQNNRDFASTLEAIAGKAPKSKVRLGLQIYASDIRSEERDWDTKAERAAAGKTLGPDTAVPGTKQTDDWNAVVAACK